MAIKKIVQQRRNDTNNGWDVLHAQTSADVVVYDDSQTQLNANTTQEAIEGLQTLITDLNAEDISYNSQLHNIENNVKQMLDGILYLFSFVNLYINGGQSASTFYTGSFIDGGSSSTIGSPNAIMDAGYSQEYNQL